MKQNDVTLKRVCEGLLSYWLRHGRGAGVDALANHINVPARIISKLIRGTTRFDRFGEDRIGTLEESDVPGFRTIAGNRHYHTPVTWEPTLAYLTARLRGEGREESDWIVRANVMPLGNLSFGGVRREYKVVALTEKEALERAKARALEEFPNGVHSNSTWRAEWHGRFFVSDPQSVEDTLKRIEERNAASE